MRGKRCALELRGARIEVDPSVGGRVTSLRVGDVELLSGPEVDESNYGSTFWTSPQSDWGWPPPEEIDRAPYELSRRDGAIELAGPVYAPMGVRVSKRFRADAVLDAFELTYVIHNVGASPRACAPWEVTRVGPAGLTFFPTGSPSAGTLKLDERDDATWYAHAPGPLPVAGQKSYADGSEGLLAHVAAGVLFVKRVEEVAKARQAPGHGAVEVYACPRYVELEVQGPYATIAPGASAAWTVVWYARKLPDGLLVSPGSGELLAFARRVARRAGAVGVIG